MITTFHPLPITIEKLDLTHQKLGELIDNSKEIQGYHTATNTTASQAYLALLPFQDLPPPPLSFSLLLLPRLLQEDHMAMGVVLVSS